MNSSEKKVSDRSLSIEPTPFQLRDEISAFRPAVIGLVGSSLGLVINFSYLVVVARSLDSSSVSGVAVLSGIILVLGISCTAIQVTTSRGVATTTEQHSIQEGGPTWTSRIMRVGAVSSLLWIIVSQFIADLLNLSYWEVSSVALFFVIYPLLAIELGKLHGSNRITAWVILGLLGAFLRLILGAATSVFVRTATAVSLAQSFAMSLLLVVTYRFSRRTKTPQLRFRSKSFLVSFACLGLFAALSNLDVILAKALLNSVDAAQYSIIATFSKSLVGVVGIIGMVIFPRLASVRRESGSINRTVRLTAIVTILITLLLAFPAATVASHAIVPVFGSTYEPTINHLGLAAAISVPWSGVYVATHSRLVESTWRLSAILLLGSTINLAMLVTLVTSIESLLIVQAVVGTVTLIVLIIVPTHSGREPSISAHM